MIRCALDELIDKKGVTQTEISNATGITRPTLLALKNNDAQGIKFSTLYKLCNYFNININDLLVSDVENERNRVEQLNDIIAIANKLKKDSE